MIRKLLIVDDEPDIRTIAGLAAKRSAGWEVIGAGSGAEGLELARSERPDVILLDVMMPQMSGIELIERLRALPETAGIPVIFLTARVQQDETERYLGLGAAGVIAKPFDVLGLTAEIERIIASG